MDLATVPMQDLDRFFEAVNTAGLVINGLYSKESITLTTDPDVSDEEAKACQQFVDAFDFSDAVQVAWETQKQKAEAVTKLLGETGFKLLLDYIYGEIKLAVPGYVIPDTTKLEADLAAKVEVKP